MNDTKTYYIWPLGCQTNKSDGERVAAILDKMGYSRVDSDDNANIVAVVACAIRQSAVDRIYGKFRKWGKRQRDGELITILTGCVLPHDKKRLTPKFDLVFDIEDLPKLPLMLAQTSMEVTVDRRDQMEYFDIKPIRNSSFRAWVPIMKGCDKFCTYCAVPYTRGRERSRSSAEILKEVESLIDEGYKDIHLLGQNVNSYGMDNYNEITFAELMNQIASLDGNFWLRFHAPHPRDFTADVIEVIARHEKICSQINLPAQSGNNQVLRKMNRPYTREKYLEIIRDIKAGIPNVSLSTDIIVGFCDETEEQFLDSVSLMKECEYDMAFTAQYSMRPGTVAARRFEDNIDPDEKRRREDELTKVLEQTFTANQQKNVGKVDRILVEKYSKDHWLGRNEHFITVEFNAPEDAQLRGTFQNIELQKVAPFRFTGKLV
ncbi:MAG: tRNA (N6-isopentenyl adenosine(37)-C2)-methylthiotransferase MiaB [bacterium]|nr:tRNA (N6-isopentenyl adenosine(37)-C2)-methylthiotransferase MiaB [bacterium]